MPSTRLPSRMSRLLIVLQTRPRLTALASVTDGALIQASLSSMRDASCGSTCGTRGAFHGARARRAPEALEAGGERQQRAPRQEEERRDAGGEREPRMLLDAHVVHGAASVHDDALEGEAAAH